jgi:hypothetical protein
MGLLTRCGKCYLTSSVFYYFSPDLFDPQTRYSKRLLYGTDNFRLFIRGKIFRIDLLAEMVGTTRPRANLFMNRFKKQGFIKL